jgi:hypothetical protein
MIPLYVLPGDQVAGSPLSVLWKLVCDRPPDGNARYRTVPPPAGPSTAIQYCVPAATATGGTATTFQAPFADAAIVPCVSSPPGLLPLPAYSPTATGPAALPASR